MRSILEIGCNYHWFIRQFVVRRSVNKHSYVKQLKNDSILFVVLITIKVFVTPFAIWNLKNVLSFLFSLHCNLFQVLHIHDIERKSDVMKNDYETPWWVIWTIFSCQKRIYRFIVLTSHHDKYIYCVTNYSCSLQVW